jgi:transcriptional regulator NrdR family protein
VKCPHCEGKTRVIDIKYPYEGSWDIKKRRHACLDCGARFNSYQEIDIQDLHPERASGEIQ